MKPIIVVAFGDSMTQAVQVPPEKRWTALLSSRLNRERAPTAFAVVNAGAGGNTSREGLARIEKDVLAHKPDWTLIEFGGNDATDDAARAVPFEEFERNLEDIYQRVRDIGSKVAFITFPPVIDVWHGWTKKETSQAKFGPAGGSDLFINAYRRLTRTVAARHECPLIDWYRAVRTAIEQGAASSYILPDGVHFTEQGNRVAFEEVYRVLQPEL